MNGTQYHKHLTTVLQKIEKADQNARLLDLTQYTRSQFKSLFGCGYKTGGILFSQIPRPLRFARLFYNESTAVIRNQSNLAKWYWGSFDRRFSMDLQKVASSLSLLHHFFAKRINLPSTNRFNPMLGKSSLLRSQIEFLAVPRKNTARALLRI